ncbi:MAG: hypothetical protein EMLJLAPB_00109 [Candidatus Argoarchaeum ethanivorans]|uniref:Archaeal Zn-finger protein n=1 Tax=Candidatus Argoarchaeum ethanivorans TaxID=2608793 RepID=A0A811T9N6_9EURY|nr:MAG: hypothetical protein EMLJLAPB_00109 [Candidatus Argoarchaeum ethanivorans]
MPELIDTYCTNCKYVTIHTILKGAPNQVVQCTECGSIHPMTVKKEKMHAIKVVVSGVDKTTHYTILKPADEELKIGDEFIIKTGNEGATIVHVTSIESEARRLSRATVKNIKTVWTRDIEEITLKVAINLGQKTKSIKYKVQGDKEFIIGSTEHYKTGAYIIKKIKLRDRGFVFREGKRVLAKDIQRIFAEAGRRKDMQQD